MWEAKSSSDDSKELSHKMGKCVTFAIVAVVIALFWNKERFSPCTSFNKLSMLSFCVMIIIVISLANSLGFFKSSEKVRDYYEDNYDMMSEIILGKSECVIVEEAAIEEEVPTNEVKFICRAEDICIHNRQSSEVGSSPRVQGNTDNHNTQKKLRDMSVGSEVMVVKIPSNNYVVTEYNDLEEFNKRADDFIAKFNRQIRLEAQQSSSRYQQILPASRYIKAV
ncbi:hypothetical protein SUGI_1187150 [Cryptomeria japonica]|nr:hypothetical protein SUGI_1187150 [Cryptomeria japonica]